ncbi:hypothetical protein ACFL6U_25845 [Planctomycetota bacterium]
MQRFPSLSPSKMQRGAIYILVALMLPICGIIALSDASANDTLDDLQDRMQEILDQYDIPDHSYCSGSGCGQTSCPYPPTTCPPTQPTPPIDPPDYPDPPTYPVPGPCDPFAGLQGKMVTIILDGNVPLMGTFQYVCSNFIILDNKTQGRRNIISIAKILYIEQLGM